MKFDFLRMWLAIAITTHGAAGEIRKWTNNEGRVINADFVSSDGSEVTLLLNGKEIKYALNKLSAADREFVSKQATDSPKADKPTKGGDAKTGFMDHVEIRQPAYATAKEYLEGSNAKAVYNAFAKGNFPKEWIENKGSIEEMFSYDNGAMIVYAPAHYDPAKPMGVYLHVSANDQGHELINCQPVMDRLSLIYACPKGTSNKQPMMRRVKLAVDALAAVKKQWNVDEKRVCVGGLSGGGHIAMLTHAMFPQWFRASISHAAQSYLPGNGSCGHFPGLAVRDITGKDCKDHKWVVISGDKDFNYKEILKTSAEWKAERANYLFIDVPGMGHVNASPDKLEEALKWAGF